MPLASGSRLGPYEIVAPLGAGGMGEVYRARDPRLGREVAVKVLPDQVAAHPDRLARFEREARTVAALNHPNIVTLFSIEEADGRRFLTMELVEGESLAAVIEPGGLPLERVLALAIPLAEALVAAHEKGVVHRDLKPANVMVTREGRLKVLDFGLAKLAEEDRDALLTQALTMQSPVSAAGMVVGTAFYMAPEQLRGEAVDARTDLFAFGILLHELASGQRPFRGDSVADVTSSILRDMPVPLAGLRADLPRDLDRIVSRCLEKKPGERFQTARDVWNELRYVRKELERARHAASNLASPPSSPSTAAAPVAKTASVAVLPFANRSRDEADEYFSEGLADELLSVLARIRGLRVAARTSSATFKGRSVTIEEAGRALNVESVLEGSVRMAGNRVRITVQLVRVADGYSLWSESYDRTLDDIFAVQDDIAQSVVRELRTTLLGEAPDSKGSGEVRAEVAAAAKGRAADTEAHRLYLQGRHLMDRLTADDNATAVTLFRRSLELDPVQPLTWAWLSYALSNMAGYGWGPLHECFTQAREAAERALSLAPDLAEAYAAKGRVHVNYDFDFAAANACFDRALELAPDSVDVLQYASVTAMVRGQLDHALELGERAVALDPLSSSAYFRHAYMLRQAGRFAESDAQLHKSLELSPQRIISHLVLAANAVQTGRVEEALVHAEGEPALWARLLARTLAHHAAGHVHEAAAALEELERNHAADSPYQIALAHAFMGHPDEAFRWLDRAYAERDGGLPFGRNEPLLQNIRSDPRWQKFQERMKQAD